MSNSWKSLSKSTKYGLAVLLAGLMTNYGPGTQSAAAATAVARGQYDGVTLFRGILLGSGPVAQLFPEIWESERLGQYRQYLKQPDAAWDSLQEHIISQIAERDSSFFERFGSAVQSADHLKIQNAIAEGGTRILEVVQADQSSGGWGSRGGDECFGCRCWDCYVDISVLAYAIAVGAVFVIVFIVGFFSPVEGSQSSQLQREMLVDLIATRLVAQP